ncbi:uncharacterized protein LOC142318989 isoform X2 [Lycorma delicatula]|uniref:uncharacterized protein LOC142318989 isoform X2 n=1 Tax=Lycorma delicatula TaxID=130591 RepID=UPI003F516D35
MIKTVYFFVIFSITEKSKRLVIMKVRKTQGHNQAQNLVIANVKELEAAAKLTSQQNGQVSIASVSPTTSQTTTAQLNHSLVVSPVAQTTSISAGSLKTADVLLSNVHLVSAIQSPVIWPADGILRQALMGSEKNLKGGEKIGVITESTLPADQVASPSATLVAISMTPQAPLFTSSVPQQVIMVGELGANQIILAGPSLPHVSSEVGDPTCKQIGVETTRIDLEQNAPDLLVIDDHNSFNALNVGTSTSTSVGSNSNPIQIKAGFSLMQNKVFSPSQNSRSDVHIVPHNHSDDIPDLINENHDDSMHNNNHHDDVGEEEEEEEDDEDDNSGGNNERDSFQQENRVSEVEQHSADGSGELGYTAHLLSQLSGTGALPTMSSSQVSSVLSALEPTEKSAQSNIGSLELVASKQRKSTLNNDLHPAPPSLEFVKIENNVPEIPKTTKTTSKSFEANKSAISMRCKAVVLSTNQGSKHTVFKCLDCGYLSLKENVMGNHCQRAHLLQLHHLINNKKRQLKCIGCNNIFYSKNALQVHLIQDHEVCVSEVALMVAAISDRAEKQDIDDHNKSVLPERNRLTTIVDDVCSDKETLLYSSSHKCSDTAASVPLNSVITTAVVQPVTTFPAVQLIMSSTSHTVSTPSLAVSATGKRPTLAPPPPSPLSIPVPTSLPLPLPPPPAASPAPQPSIQTPQFEGFVTEADPTFTDQRIDKNSLMESKTEALQDQNMLKDERELEEVPLEETSDAVNSITVNSCDNQSKKRGRPRGSQTLRLVRSKFKSSDVIKIEKDLGFRCGTDGCAVRLQRETNMIYHKQCHTEKYSVTLKCPECSHIATRWSSLTSHLWKMHNIDMELYSCNQCGYKTNSLWNMKKLQGAMSDKQGG